MSELGNETTIKVWSKMGKPTVREGKSTTNAADERIAEVGQAFAIRSIG